MSMIRSVKLTCVYLCRVKNVQHGTLGGHCGGWTVDASVRKTGPRTAVLKTIRTSRGYGRRHGWITAAKQRRDPAHPRGYSIHAID